MALLETPEVKLGWKAAPFNLQGVDGKHHSLASAKGPNGLWVMFICNHCPYVKAVIERVVRDAKELQAQGTGVIAIMPNDTANYPEDSFTKMKLFADQHGFSFPYVIDETQEVAKAYGAVCTPDFFGFDVNLTLQYRGRLDDARAKNTEPNRRELVEAMKDIAEKGKVTTEQFPSMGCSIKWKDAA